MGKRKVDLGLPSGTLWATCNVGADAPEEYGDYFAWGETGTKDDWDCTYKYDDDDDGMTKYNSTDELTTLEAKDDAAKNCWGKEWRLPTEDEWEELINECTWTWTDLNGVNGYEVTGPNGNTIFLPASGYCSDDEYDLEDSLDNEGHYWSNSLNKDDPDEAYILYFYSGEIYGEPTHRCLGCSVRPVFCKGEEKDNLRENGICYELNKAKQTAKVRCLPNSEYSGNVVIPSTISYNGTPFRVTSIEYGAFQECTGLTAITIPESVTSIDRLAFAGCTGLTAVTIGNSVTSIEEYTFSGCKGLTSITIPESVTSIGEHAFSDCTGLTAVTIPESVTSIGEHAFSDCTGLTAVTIPESVTSIGEKAFRGCTGLTAITIPNSVTSIEWGAFYGCEGLTAVTIGNSVKSIEKSAFNGCNGLTAIVIERGNTIYDSRENCNAIIETATNTLIQGCKTTVIPNSVTSIEESAFEGCTGLTAITIPNSVTSIGKKAFRGCTGLTSITIPNSVTSIGWNAFEGCTGLTSITIPNSVTSIGWNAFEGCTGLTAITIPNSVTSIGCSAFSGCMGLTAITIPNSVTSIGSSAFSGCMGLTAIVVESGNTVYDSRENCNAIIETATNTLIQGCKTTVIPNSVTSIGSSAFFRCTGLTAITIPESVTSIGNGAFQECTGLTAITIPESVTSIDRLAFAGCTGLTAIVIERGNTIYDSRENCNAIIETATNTLIQGCKTTVIPNSVTSIGEKAFRGCTGLTAVTIPESVTSIGEHAFSDCTGLTSITIPNSVTSIGDFAFIRCTGLTDITIPNRVTTIGWRAFSGCTGLTAVTIPESVTSIDASAFEDCTSLTSITIPNSVTSIGYGAFYKCTGLTAITLPKTITEIEEDIFYGCEELQTICVPQGMTEAFCTMGLEPWRDKIVENTPSEQSTQKKKDAMDKKQQEHEYVDLGLPSGTLWASCNVGAEKPENYGNYYAWGETETKDNYSGDSYEYGSDLDNMTKYNTTDGLTTLEAKDDAATANWGEEWRMPTEDEWFELIDECTWTWTDLNGVNGYKVKGPNGNTIFLPVSGYCTDDRRRRTGRYGNYWSSSLDTDAGYAEIAFFSASNCYVQGNRRCDGISVRPVFCKGEEEKDNLRENTLSCDVYDEPSQDYVIIKTRSEFIEARGSLYEATRHYWHAKLEKAQNYKFALSVVKGIVKEVYEVEKWFTSPTKSPRIEFEGEPTTNAEMRALIGKMIPECYRKKGLASPFLYKRK